VDGASKLQHESCKVLVVDDDRDNANTTVTLLQIWGHEAEAAYSPEDAISKALTLDPDVVIMDIGLPTMDGFDLASAVRRHCPEAKFLALTGFTQADIVRRARAAGFADVLVKPAPARLLKEAVDTECAASSSQQRLTKRVN
jgi:CheY-like chemotaxis protein